MRKMKVIRERRGKKSFIFYLLRMVCLTRMCRLPINHSGLCFPLFTSSSPSSLSSYHCRFSSLLFTFVSLLSPLPLSPCSSLPFLTVYPYNFLSFSLLQFSTDPSRKCVCRCVCVSAYAAFSCVSQSVWQRRWIGLYLGKQNINKERRQSALMPVFSLRRSRTWRTEGLFTSAGCCVPLRSATGINKRLKNGPLL